MTLGRMIVGADVASVSMAVSRRMSRVVLTSLCSMVSTFMITVIIVTVMTDA